MQSLRAALADAFPRCPEVVEEGQHFFYCSRIMKLVPHETGYTFQSFVLSLRLGSFRFARKLQDHYHNDSFQDGHAE
jgi:hypothetical protein